MFSLTSKQSFQDIKSIREQIIRVKGTERVPIVIAANKSDMYAQREVLAEDLAKLANEWNIPYMESSAKNTKNVNDLFAEIVKQMNLQPSKEESDYSCGSCCTIQ